MRELRNVIERATLLAEQPRPQAHGLGVDLSRSPGDAANPAGSAATGVASDAGTAVAVDVQKPFKDQKNDLVAKFEEAYVRLLMAACGGNIARAARQAGIDRMYLYKLLSRYELEGSGRDRT